MNFVLEEKAYDFILYLYRILRYFPKSEKFALNNQIKNKAIDFMSMVNRANKQYDKKESILECDVLLDDLRKLIRLSKDLEFLGISKYENCCKALAEIGRILGGWKKACG